MKNWTLNRVSWTGRMWYVEATHRTNKNSWRCLCLNDLDVLDEALA